MSAITYIYIHFFCNIPNLVYSPTKLKLLELIVLTFTSTKLVDPNLSKREVDLLGVLNRKILQCATNKYMRCTPTKMLRRYHNN